MLIAKKICIFILAISLLPLQVFALSPEDEIRKNELLGEYESALVDADNILDDLIDYVDTHSTALSAAVSIELMVDLVTALENKDLEAFVNAVDLVFEDTDPVIVDLKLLEPSIRDLYDTKLPLAKEMLQFIKDHQSELKVTDFSTAISSSVDISLKSIILLDKMNNVINNSSLGELDLIAIMESEFEEEVDRARTKVDELLINQQALLIESLDNIKNDIITTPEKITKIIEIIEYIENVKTQGLSKFQTATNSVSASGSVRYINEAKTTFDNEISESIIIAKKYLIDNITVNSLDSNLTTSELDQILLPVYAPTLNSNSFLFLSNPNRLLTSYALINDTTVLDSIINPNYGTISFTNLVAGRVATGTRLRVSNGTEDVLEYTFIVKGDLLGRGISNTTDLFRLIDAALGSNPISGIYRNAADMNDDTRTDISDIIKLIDEILGN